MLCAKNEGIEDRGGKMTTQLATYISKSQTDLAIGIDEDDAIFEKAESLLVKGCNDDDDLQDFADTIVVLDKRSKAVLKARTAFVDPFKKDIRAIEMRFNGHRTELDEFLIKLNKMFIAYQMKRKAELEREAEARREQERKEEAERIARQREKDAVEATLKAEMEAESKLFNEDNERKEEEEDGYYDDDVDEKVFDESPSPEPAQTEVLPPVKPLNIATPKIKTASGATVKIKQEPVPIIRNKNLVPEIYKDVNLRRLILAYEDGVHDVPGVEFVLKNKSVVR